MGLLSQLLGPTTPARLPLGQHNRAKKLKKSKWVGMRVMMPGEADVTLNSVSFSEGMGDKDINLD